MSSILGSIEGGVIGVAVGEGAAAAVEPAVEPAKQQVWDGNRYRILDLGQLAELVVQRITNLANVQDQAHRQGFDDNKLRAVVEATFRAPGTAEALELWRRGRINGTQFTHALHKAGLEEQYIKPVAELFGERLAPADVANAIQQGFLADDNVLPKPAPPAPGWVPGDPPFKIQVDQVALKNQEQQPVTTTQEARASGIDFERLRVLAELAGLPPGEETLLDMWRRGILDGDGYSAGLREGHTKTKWTAALSARFYQLLPAGVVVRLRLKGWIDDAQFHERMRLHGYRPAQADDWFHSEGRPATTHQALIGIRRGGVYDNAATAAADYFQKAVKQSDIRNEWIDILWAQRETFPAGFFLRRLLQDGVFTADEGHDILYKSGWNSDYARTVADHYAASAGTGADPHTKQAQTQLWGTTHRSFIAGESDNAIAGARFDLLGIPAADQTVILALWESERELIRRQLTPAQVKKAYEKVTRNYATGQPWTRDDALAALVARGYTVTEANDYLDIPSR